MMCMFLYSLSLGPTTWVYTSEILPPKGVGIAVTVNWLMIYAIAKVCPFLFESPLGTGGVFCIFGAFTFGVFFFSLPSSRHNQKMTDISVFDICAKGNEGKS